MRNAECRVIGNGLTPAEIALMWQTAPPRMPIPAPARFPGLNPKGIAQQPIEESTNETLARPAGCHRP